MSEQPGFGASTWRVEYLLDNEDILTTYGIYVKSSDELFDVPERKIGYRHNWLDDDGEEVDLSNVVLENRTIKLECFLQATKTIDAIKKFNTFIAAIDQTGTRTLEIKFSTADIVKFDVYREDKVKVVKRFKEFNNIWSFTLRLRVVAVTEDGGVIEDEPEE